MDRLFSVLGACGAFLGVLLGAFAAHGLRSQLEPRLLDTFEIAVRYQMYHCLGLFVVAWLAARGAGSAVLAGWAFVAGILLFSGSLYGYALSGVRVLAMITPVGGLCFLLGWGALAWAALRAP
jgi:uncharacterized membrane protein YgdD (TMEM256/DUF423 family)